MKKSTKILVLLLTLVFALSAFTVFAFAEDAPGAQTDGNSEAASDTTEEVKPIEVKFTTENFLTALNYLWQGMLCIFIVIGALVLVTYCLNKASNAIANRDTKSGDNQ